MTDQGRHEEPPAAVDGEALLALSKAHHERTVRAWGTREVGGHLAKVYVLQAPGRAVTDRDAAAALRTADGHLALGGVRGSLGLAVVVVHAGGDGDYVLV